MGTLAFNISCLAKQHDALPEQIQRAAAEVLTAAEAAGHHIPAVSWFNPDSTPEHHVRGFPHQGGVAVDFMIYGDTVKQDFTDHYVWANRSRLGICWLISRRRIRSTSPGHSANWTRYNGANPHKDHTHVNFGHLAGTSGESHVKETVYVPLAPIETVTMYVRPADDPIWDPVTSNHTLSNVLPNGTLGKKERPPGYRLIGTVVTLWDHQWLLTRSNNAYRLDYLTATEPSKNLAASAVVSPTTDRDRQLIV